MWFKSVSIIFLKSALHGRTLCCLYKVSDYIYIYIYILFVDLCDAWKQIIIHLPKIELQERIKNQERE